MRAYLVTLGAFLTCVACASKSTPATYDSRVGIVSDSAMDQSKTTADVVGVEVSGEPGAYSFSVTLKTGDTGCDHYADWWEVVDADGNLVYRRILGHSHVKEQPFTRSGGPVDVSEDALITVRAHMSDVGYGGRVLEGMPSTPNLGATPKADTLGSGLEEQAPQPDGCAF